MFFEGGRKGERSTFVWSASPPKPTLNLISLQLWERRDMKVTLVCVGPCRRDQLNAKDQTREKSVAFTSCHYQGASELRFSLLFVNLPDASGRFPDVIQKNNNLCVLLVNVNVITFYEPTCMYQCMWNL